MENPEPTKTVYITGIKDYEELVSEYELTSTERPILDKMKDSVTGTSAKKAVKICFYNDKQIACEEIGLDNKVDVVAFQMKSLGGKNNIIDNLLIKVSKESGTYEKYKRQSRNIIGDRRYTSMAEYIVNKEPTYLKVDDVNKAYSDFFPANAIFKKVPQEEDRITTYDGRGDEPADENPEPLYLPRSELNINQGGNPPKKKKGPGLVDGLLGGLFNRKKKNPKDKGLTDRLEDISEEDLNGLSDKAYNAVIQNIQDDTRNIQKKWGGK